MTSTTTAIPNQPTAHPADDAAGITRKARVIAYANQKGGSGKTSSVIATGGALADKGYRVCIIDCDEQGNATIGFGQPKNEVGTYLVLIDDEADVNAAIVSTNHPGIDIMPGHLKLSEVAPALASVVGNHAILAEAIDQFRDRYDFILIDCPPSLSILTINALYAADEVLVPVRPGYFDLDGLAELRKTVKRVRDRLARPTLDIRHVIVTHFDGRTINSRDAYTILREAFGDRLIDTAEPEPDKPWYGSGVPVGGNVSTSHSVGIPLTVYDKRGKATKAYRVITDVIEQRGPVSA